MKTHRKSKKAPFLGVAAVAAVAALGAGLVPSVAAAAPAAKVALTGQRDLSLVGLMDGYQLHAPPAGPGFWGKGAGAGTRGYHHRHHR